MTEDCDQIVPDEHERVKETLAWVESQIQKQIHTFDKKRKFDRTAAYRFAKVITALSSVITVLISISRIYNSTWISVVALVISAGMSVLSAWESLYGYRQRWIQNNDTLMKLYALESEIQYQKVRSVNKIPIEKVDLFHQRYQEILNNSNQRWFEDRSQLTTQEKS